MQKAGHGLARTHLVFLLRAKTSLARTLAPPLPRLAWSLQRRPRHGGQRRPQGAVRPAEARRRSISLISVLTPSSTLLRCPICGDWFNTATCFSRCSHNCALGASSDIASLILARLLSVHSPVAYLQARMPHLQGGSVFSVLLVEADVSQLGQDNTTVDLRPNRLLDDIVKCFSGIL